MNHQWLEQLQDEAYEQLKREGAAATDPARRAELLADAREQRLLTMINDAVFMGTLKAHLVLILVAVVAWVLLVRTAVY